MEMLVHHGWLLLSLTGRFSHGKSPQKMNKKGCPRKWYTIVMYFQSINESSIEVQYLKLVEVPGLAQGKVQATCTTLTQMLFKF